MLCYLSDASKTLLSPTQGNEPLDLFFLRHSLPYLRSSKALSVACEYSRNKWHIKPPPVGDKEFCNATRGNYWPLSRVRALRPLLFSVSRSLLNYCLEEAFKSFTFSFNVATVCRVRHFTHNEIGCRQAAILRFYIFGVQVGNICEVGNTNANQN